VPVEKLRWRLDPKTLPFATTAEIEPLEGLLGQERGVDAFHFGAGVEKEGYNLFVTGPNDIGRLSNVERLLKTVADGRTPEDLCYVNNFKNPDEPLLLRFKAGEGSAFKKDMGDFVEALKTEIPQLFESQNYVQRKSEVISAYEERSREFFKELNNKVKDTGFALVNVQMGEMQRPELMPIVDNEPVPLMKLEDMVEKGRFPRPEYERMKERYEGLKKEIDEIFLKLRDLQKEVKEKSKEMDKILFRNAAAEFLAPVRQKYPGEKIAHFLDSLLDDLAENIRSVMAEHQVAEQGGLPPGMPPIDFLQPYRANLIVDNAEQKGRPIIIENNPTYRNIFGAIERIVDRSGVWRTDFSKIRAGALVQANGGFLVLNLMDAIIEPGVWPALKRALKSTKMEIQTYDPFYFFTSTGLKPEPIDLDVKVVVLADEHIYHLLNAYDEDMPNIFKVRADFGSTMDKTDDHVLGVARFVRREAEEDKLLPFHNTAVAALVEEGVRRAGRQEKITTAFPRLADLLREADYFARSGGKDVVTGEDVDRAVEARIHRANRIEEIIREMIQRGSLKIDVAGEAVGQVNGLAVYDLGDIMFGKPSRITCATSMGKEGVINIEREAELSGSTHNKGMLILSGYLRRRFAQDKPLSMAASIAFEQSYGGIDGDSASSTEMYALLSSLSEVPIRQGIAVTGSLNQKGEVQAIGGVNAKIEGFYDTCKVLGLTGEQGVMIPESNVQDLMLRKDVVEAVEKGRFHVWSVRTIDQGIELLTGRPAGARDGEAAYPEGSINALVDAKLTSLAMGLKEFGEAAEKKEEKEKPKTLEQPEDRTGFRLP
jgi:lon-related putative ATP-dependent protease